MTCVWRHDDVGNLFHGQRFPSHQRFFLSRQFLLYNYIIDLLAKHLLNFSWGFQTSEKFRGQNKGNNFPVTSSLSVLLFLIDHGQRPIIALVTLYSPHFITKIISRVCRTTRDIQRETQLVLATWLLMNLTILLFPFNPWKL